MGGATTGNLFMDHGQMDFECQFLLGGAYYGAADAGEILTTAGRIPSGDFERWYAEWLGTAQRLEKSAETSAASGAAVSARGAFLRSAAYHAAAAVFIDGTSDPSRGVDAWKKHLAAWERFVALLTPPAEKVDIPYEGTTMPGYFFRPADSAGRLATIIFMNGSDGPTSAMWASGVAGALERGYAALIFDGPGQNSMLWLRNVPFRPDWEKVITPVVDFLGARSDVDLERIALSGLSQGGHWVLRALAFEHRVAAGIADPGVMNVSTKFFESLPQELTGLLDAGQADTFDQYMEEGLNQAPPQVRQNLQWRMKPYGVTRYYDLYRAVRGYDVSGVVGQIECPMLIADPENEQFWPGQSKQVYDALTCPKVLVDFTAAEGADGHCEPKARSLYDQRMFDWLAGIMPA